MSSPSYFNRVLPGASPGTVLVNGEEVSLKDFTEGYIWDTEKIPATTTITAQKQLFFFSNLTFQLVAGVRKLKVDTSMTEPNRLPTHWQAIIKNIYVGFRPPVKRLDVEAVLNSAYVSFILGQQRVEREGPLYCFPMPFGISGALALDGNTTATEVTEFQNGVVAKSAVPNMLPIYIPGGMPFQVTVEFDYGFTAQGDINLAVILAGYISKPVM